MEKDSEEHLNPFLSIKATTKQLPIFVSTLHGFLRFFIDATSWIINCIRRKDEPLALIENYRQGPVSNDRWSFLLWRLTFPIFTLLLCIVVIVLGQCGLTVYTLIACPLWYYAHFVLQVTPFFLIYSFQHIKGRGKTLCFKVLGLISISISIVEWVFTVQPSSGDGGKQQQLSWLIGNTLYGLLGYFALPVFLYLQPRIVRDFAATANHSNQSSVETAAAITPDAIFDDPEGALAATNNYNTSTKASNFVLYVAGAFVTSVWLASFATYLAPETNSFQWLSVTSVVLVIVTTALYWKYSSSQPTTLEFSIEYLIFYGTTAIHVPVYVGHLSLSALDEVESWSDPTTVSGARFGISLGFLITMQLFSYFLVAVVKRMSTSDAYPSLLYISQLSYYLFWYMLVGSGTHDEDAPFFDTLYVGLLMLNNIHIVLVNTGLYSDIWENGRTGVSNCVTLSKNSCGKTGHRKKRNSSGHHCNNISTKTDDSFLPTTSATPSDSCGRRLHLKKYDEDYKTSTSSDSSQPLYFLMKMAEQDNMADTSALVLVPTLLTILAYLDAPAAQSTHLLLQDKLNMWLRCILMFLGRICSSYIAQEIFSCKLRRRQTLLSSSTSNLRIQGIMLQDFQRQFWYLTVVTIVCTFACFDRLDRRPSRYAFLNDGN